MENNYVILAEYNSLREEIKTNSQLIAQIFTVTITASAILIGYGINAEDWIILLSPFAIIIPSLLFISSQMEGTVKIATYIKIYIEPQLDDLKWESRLAQLPKSKSITGIKYSLSIIGIYSSLGIISLVLSWIFLFSKEHRSIHIIVLSIVTATLVFLMITIINGVWNCFKQDLFSKYSKAWQELVNNETHSSPTGSA